MEYKKIFVIKYDAPEGFERALNVNNLGVALSCIRQDISFVAKEVMARDADLLLLSREALEIEKLRLTNNLLRLKIEEREHPIPVPNGAGGKND